MAQMLRVTFTFCCLAIVAVVPAAAGAGRDQDADGVRYFADLSARYPASDARVVISAGTERGSFRLLSRRAYRDVQAVVPAAARGRVVGRFTFATPDGQRALALRVPRRHDGRRVVLARSGEVRVLLRPGHRIPLTISGLPSGTFGVGISTLGRGLGILGPARPCPARPTLDLYALRRGAAPALARSGVRC